LRVKRRVAITVATIVAVIVVVVVLARRDDPAPEARATPARTDGSAAIPTVANRAPEPVPIAVTPHPELGAPGLSTDDPLTAYLKQNVYPPTSRPLTAEHVDLLKPNTRHETPRPTDGEDSDVDFLFTADRYFVLGAETITPTLALVRDRTPVAFTVTQAFVAVLDPKATADSPRYPFTLGAPFAPSTIPNLARQTALGAFLEFTFEGKTQRAKLDFQFTPAAGIPARFTGALRDELVAGSLVIHTGVAVERAGSYLIDANLMDASDRPIAWTRAKVTLERGERTVDLEFFGKALVDQRATGAFKLGQLRGARFALGEDPDLEQMPPFTGSFVTHAYTTDQFSSAEWDSEHKRDMIRTLTDQRDRGGHQGPATPPTR